MSFFSRDDRAGRNPQATKPEKRRALIARDEAELAFVDGEARAGAPLLLDTCVYIHVLRGKTPQNVDGLLRLRTLLHSATALSELSSRLGARVPGNRKERNALAQLAGTISDVPAHRIVVPSAGAWVGAGVLAGMRSRLGGFNAGQEQKGLNDALLLLQSRNNGAILLTADVSDFDLLQQLVPNSRVLFYRALP
jgi:predicted nucleic acid-binding protein